MLGLALVSKQNLAEGIKALEKVSPPAPVSTLSLLPYSVNRFLLTRAVLEHR
jgi:hypothetical protein